MKSSILIALAACGLCITAGCSKKSDPAPLTKTQTLSAQKWVPVSMILKLSVKESFVNALIPDSLRQIDLFGQGDICLSDNPFNFKADNTYFTTDEGIECAEFTPDEGTWSLNADDTKFTLVSERILGDIEDLPIELPIDLEAVVRGLFADMNVQELKPSSFKTTKTIEQKLENFRIPDFPLPLTITLVLTLEVSLK